MQLGVIYDLFVREGIKTDLRHRRQISQNLRRIKQQYQRLAKQEKPFFDKECLSNPYSDTRVLWGERDREVHSLLVGIDIDTGEILLADRLRAGGQRIDAVLAHHPQGVALAGLDEVMDLQTDVLKNLGLRPPVAQGVMNKRTLEVARRLHSSNHARMVDAARLLDIPVLCCHTPADNHVATYLQNLVDRRNPTTLQRLVDLLLKEPEYQDAARLKAGPQIWLGNPSTKAGKIFVDMTGGTEGAKEIYGRLSQLGIETILAMHLSEAHFNVLKSEYINVVVAGHMASDNLGMNLLLDKLDKKEPFEIVACSGFRRFRRHGVYSR